MIGQGLDMKKSRRKHADTAKPVETATSGPGAAPQTVIDEGEAL